MMGLANSRTALRLAAIAACAVLSIAATGTAGRGHPKAAATGTAGHGHPKAAAAAKTGRGRPALPAKTPPASWNASIAVTANGSHRIGNPAAPIRLTEYVSYTCPHCAHYTREADPALRLTVIPKGQVSVTVTNLLRNPVDLTVAMLTNCGSPGRFFVRHNAFFATQDTWLAKAMAASQAQQQRWYQDDTVASMRAIASDLDFYARMAGWGISRAQADACLADKAALAKIEAQQQEVAGLRLSSTPSFTINGQVIDAHDWASVSHAITDKLAEQRAGAI